MPRRGSSSYLPLRGGVLGEPVLQVLPVFTVDVPDAIFVAHDHRGLATWLHATMPALIEERRAALSVGNLGVLKYPHRLTTTRARLTDTGHRDRIALVLRHRSDLITQPPSKKFASRITGDSV
jgi:hypothetical protein